jgi:hypothetical protein
VGDRVNVSIVYRTITNGMRGKPLRGRTAMAHDHTTDTRIAAPRDSHTRHSPTHCRLHTPPNHSSPHAHSPRIAVPTRLPNWDVTRLASLSDGGRFRSAQRCDSVARNNKTKTNTTICSALMGCSDARRVTSQSSSRHAKPPTRASSSHATPIHLHPTHLSPEYASAVTLPRISSESVKKMALAQRKKAF